MPRHEPLPDARSPDARPPVVPCAANRREGLPALVFSASPSFCALASTRATSCRAAATVVRLLGVQPPIALFALPRHEPLPDARSPDARPPVVPLPIARLPDVRPPVVQPRREPPFLTRGFLSLRLQSCCSEPRGFLAFGLPVAWPRRAPLLPDERPPVSRPQPASPPTDPPVWPIRRLAPERPGRFAPVLDRRHLDARASLSPGSKRSVLPRSHLAPWEREARPTCAGQRAPRRSRPAWGSSQALRDRAHQRAWALSQGPHGPRRFVLA